jgi:hypothetical protein
LRDRSCGNRPVYRMPPVKPEKKDKILEPALLLFSLPLLPSSIGGYLKYVTGMTHR